MSERRSTDTPTEERPDWRQRAREALEDPDICSRCHGKGYITVPGTLRIARRPDCIMCDGTGRIETDDESDT